MLIFFAVLILIASVILGFFVLVQNPKGGGLSGTFGGFSSQTMGVRQTTDFLEKGTWALIIIIAGLCLFSSFFIPKSSATGSQKSEMNQDVNLPAPPPAMQYPMSNGSQSAPQPQQQTPSNTPAQTPTKGK
jgi:preprotein translocase subunit SecG